ncbi:Mrp/NBP35 family ATP-binding protein [Pajaroellobacter abortibovis]|uniref:Iron-sulfur cluster carrier protein n=1 Tax=Pajaroellobacter abortibovis TaxID=1882918 RepID=A0A1L6MW67_9BACT|nr:Mrp/NBP35 family ATP-binding protein [Pajaroellobacter abortibovis]APR99665.1 hypothetical protein BCY86_02470 [Pajaroellobacter abortibovis]
MPLEHSTLYQTLASVQDPLLQKPITELGIVSDLSVMGGEVHLVLDLRGKERGERGRHSILGSQIREKLSVLPELRGLEIRWREEVISRSVGQDDPVPHVKQIVFVMSGKGGVGKSTIATNLAATLCQMGYRVGILDADIYGPSIPTMLGIHSHPFSVDGKSIEPLERFGMKLMSIGFLLEDPKSAVIWRGPMLHSALQQFLKDVNWGPLDYLVLDLPPGTGDVSITLSQRVRASGAVLVTTPQAVATDDVFKSVSMCQKVHIPVLGVIENMSYFVDQEGCRYELFGRGGGEAVARFASAPLFGQIPIELTVRECGDQGAPAVQVAPFAPLTSLFVGIAEKLIDRIEALHAEEDTPVIDRVGGEPEKKKLPVVR